MQNIGLAKDYIIRAEHRLAAVQTLVKLKSWADVVRESQEIVELTLKSLLRYSKIEVPRLHDVSGILREEQDKLPESIRKHLAKITKISKSMRRDRELAFYGSEDLTPSEFYSEEDAQEAFSNAKWTVDIIKPIITD